MKIQPNFANGNASGIGDMPSQFMVAGSGHVRGNLGVDSIGLVTPYGHDHWPDGGLNWANGGGPEAVVGCHFFDMDVLSFEVQFHEVKRFRIVGGYAVISEHEIQVHMGICDRGEGVRCIGRGHGDIHSTRFHGATVYGSGGL